MTDDKDRQLSEIRSDIEATRQKLAETLDAIEDRLDVPKRVREMLTDARDRLDGFLERLDALRQERPEVVYGAIAGALALVASATALIVRGARR